MNVSISALIEKISSALSSVSLKWYMNRLKRMSKAEVFFRLIDIFVKFQLSLFPKGPKREFSYINFDWEYIQYCQFEVRSNNEIPINDSIVIYGKDWSPLNHEGINWESFLSGVNSKKIRTFKIRYRDSERLEDDIRFSWELNRMTWLYSSAFSKDKSRNLQALEYLRDFLESDHPGHGLRWNSMIEIAIQSISLQLLSSRLAQYLDASDQELLQVSLSNRYRWLQKLPSRYSSNNNHRIAELAALIFLAESAGIRKFSECYQNRLLRELERQTLRDGFNAELSPDYHLFVLELVVVLCKLLPDLKFISELSSRALQMLSVAQSIERINQVWPSFNDSDDAMLLSALVSSDKRIDFLSEFFGVRPIDETRQLLTLSDAGYTFLQHKFRDSLVSIAIDHGAIGFGDIAAHGHADSLALWLVIDKIPVLVESGTYSYHSNLALRNYLRSGIAHNTITIDQESLSSPEGPFLWNPKNCAQSSLVKAEYDSKTGIIQVIAKYKKTNTHEAGIAVRTVSIDENFLTVEDTATSGDSLESHFILSPAFQLKERRGDVGYFFTNDNGITFTLSCDPQSTISIMPVDISPSYGVLEKSCRVTVHGKSGITTQFRFDEMGLS
jgi:hypothetical protein